MPLDCTGRSDRIGSLGTSELKDPGQAFSAIIRPEPPTVGKS